MNLANIVNQTLGIGNPFGKSEKRDVYEPIWYDVTFNNLDGGEHKIMITYGKNSSTHSYDDRGYLAIPKPQ